MESKSINIGIFDNKPIELDIIVYIEDQNDWKWMFTVYHGDREVKRDIVERLADSDVPYIIYMDLYKIGFDLEYLKTTEFKSVLREHVKHSEFTEYQKEKLRTNEIFS